MTLQLQNTEDAKRKLDKCDIAAFQNSGCSFTHFLSEIEVKSFRHIRDLTIKFTHPISILAGTNTIGKTSVLLLLACSHEKFMKIDSTSASAGRRIHEWKDVLSFTSHENMTSDYSYSLRWRVANKLNLGEGKRLATSKAWSGLGKKSADKNRINAKIRDREVRLIDLERILPGRSFSRHLFRKANLGKATRLSSEIEEAFSYVFDLPSVEISEVASHLNKSCFLINKTNDSYSSFNAASGEESVICLLQDVVGSPKHTLILVDEMEAGFHPYIQRRLADIFQYIAWRDKKQFIISTHSPTLISAFTPESRRFIEKNEQGTYRVIKAISPQAARSKMDALSYPLVRLYCEDNLASYLIRKILVEISDRIPQFQRLVNIIESGPINEVKNDYERHKRNMPQFVNKLGFCAVFDGDYKDDPGYSKYFENTSEKTLFLYPYDAPEKFLVKAYLSAKPNESLKAALKNSDHHALFSLMVNKGLATDIGDARDRCYLAFKSSPEYVKHETELRDFLLRTVANFSELPE